MGAYFQTQVETTFKGKKDLFIQEGFFVKFMECQYALNPTFTNVVRRLSTHTNEETTGKIWCVCDYDKKTDESKNVREWAHQVTTREEGRPCGKNPVNPEITSEWHINKTPIENKYSEIAYNRAGLREEDDVIEDGTLGGFVVSKTSGEYLDVNKCLKAAYQGLDLEQPQEVLNPLAILTRHSKWRMGGGDIRWSQDTYPDFVDVLARWYGDDVYWTIKRPSALLDITEIALWYEDDETMHCKIVYQDNIAFHEVA